MRNRSLGRGLRAALAIGMCAAAAATLVACGGNAADKPRGTWKAAYGSPDDGGRYRAVTVGDATHAWAFGNTDANDDKRTRIVSWDGKKWGPDDAVPPTWRFTPEVADASSADNVWAAAETSDDAVTLAHFDGHRWSSREIDLDDLNGIRAVGDNAVLVSGDDQLVRFDGTTVTRQTAPKHADSAVEVRSADEMYAVGSHNDQPYAERWDGHQWTSMGVPAARPKNCGDAGFYDLYVRSAKDIWAVGNSECTSSFKSYIGHWNGKKWTMTVDAKRNQRFAQVTGDGDDGIWIVDSTGKYVHRDADGTLTRYDAGTEDAYGNFPSIARVPGGRSMIGVATMTAKKQSSKTPDYGRISRFRP